MKRFAVTLLLCAAAFVTSAATASAKFTFFETPSGNIGCAISGGAGVRCDIRHHSWPTPQKPADCDVDYGEGIQVGKHERASFVCAGDTVLTPTAQTLAFGERIEVKRFRCASKRKGLRCVNRRNEHGFFLSAQDVRLF